MTDISSSLPGYDIRLVAGTANPTLAKNIADHLNVELEPCKVQNFADGEINLQVERNVRGADVFVIQPTSPDVNKNLMELLLLIHTLKLSSARRIHAIVPYFGYARQDRKTKPRVPISASAVSQLIETMGPDRVVTVDLHCGQIQGFFHQTPVDNLFAENQFISYIRSKNLDISKVALVSPDAGGVTRARRIADKLHVEKVVTILKRRLKANQVSNMQVVGDVEGMVCIIADDIIDTAGTLCTAAGLLKEMGAAAVYACATHGIFSGPAIDRINNSVLTEVCVTDTIPQEHHKGKTDKIIIESVAPLLAETIKRLHLEKSLSVLFTVTEENEVMESF